MTTVALSPAETARAELVRRVGLFDGLPLETLPAPYVLDPAEEREAAETAEAVAEGVEAIGRRYLDDAGLRRALAFPEALDRAIRDVDPGYGRAAPIVRVDGHFVGAASARRLVAIESNTDGSAGFHDHDSVDAAVEAAAGVPGGPDLSGLRRAGPRDGKDLRDRLAETILGCSREARGPDAPPPLVAVVDWREEKTLYEFQAVARRLTERGAPARFCDVRDLVLDGGRLVGGRGGDPIDLVYRRVIGMDLFNRPDEAAVFWEAYRRRAAVFVGSLRSEVGWTKACLAILSDPAWNGLLPEALRRRLEGRVAETRILTREVADSIRPERGDWVLKPFWGNGARGLVVGALVDRATWEEALGACLADAGPGRGYVAQRRVPPEVRTMEVPGRGPAPLHINVSPFVLGGRYAGLYVRGAERPVVHLSGGAFTLGAFVRG